MNHFMQALMNVRNSFQKESDIIQEGDSEFDDSRIIQLQHVSSPLALHAARNYVSERSAFQRTFGKEYDLNIDELNSSAQDNSELKPENSEE